MGNKTISNQDVIKRHRGRIISISIIIFLGINLIAGLAIWLEYNQEKATFLYNLNDEKEDSLNFAAAHITHKLESIISDLNFIGQNKRIEECIANNHKDNVIEKNLIAFSRAKKFYAQIRLLCPNGKEFLRINNEQGRVYSVTDSELQDKSSCYYFQASSQIKPNEIYISNLDLNIEHDKIAIPYEPMLRFSTPIFHNRKRVGLVVLNYRAKNLLEIADSLNLAFLNGQGGWLIGGGQKNWAFQRTPNNPQLFSEEYPKIWEKITNSHEGNMIKNNVLYSYKMIHPIRKITSIKSHDYYHWVLLARVNNPYQKAGINEYALDMFLVFLGFVIILAVLLGVATYEIIIRRETDIKFRLLFKHASDPYFILKNDIITDCNQSALDLLAIKERNSLVGYKLSVFTYKLDSSNPPIDFHTFSTEKVYKNLNGKLIYVEETCNRIPHSNDEVITVWHNITDRIEHEAELKMQSRADKLTSIMSKRFLEEDVQTIINEGLRISGKFLKIERAKVWLISKDDQLIHETHRWFASPYDKTIFDTKNFLVEKLDWMVETMSKGQSAVINKIDEVDDNEDLKKYLVSAGIKSLVLIPFIREKRLMGCLSFGMFSKSRTWTPEEINFIRRFADDVAVALYRRESEEQLAIARDEAESASRAKSEFLANMSHEIRTPMNAILGFTEILTNQIKDDKCHHYLESIHSSGKALLSLINDILDLSKIEAGKLTLEYRAFNPVNVFKEMTIIFSQKIAEKGLELLTEINPNLPEGVVLDELRLRQILLNLVGNAVKFTHKGYIKLAVNAKFPSSDHSTLDFIFSVSDTGIGIEQNQQEKIFEAFEQRAGQRSSEYGGTGLGLAITRRLINAMGGEISLTSTPGEGTEFKVIIKNVAVAAALDFETDNTVESSDKLIEQYNITPGKVLIVDDVEQNRELIAAYLDETPLQGICTEDGDEALKFAEINPPDLLITDIKMPNMNGYELLKKFTSKPQLKSIPTIVLTASLAAPEQEKAKKSADGFLLKPVSRHELFREIIRVMKYKTKENIAQPSESTTLSREPIKPVKDLPKLLEVLNNLTEGLFKDLSDNIIISDAEDFTKILLDLAQKHDCPPLQTYAKKISSLIDEFDVMNLPTAIREFPGIVIKIKSANGE